ncbi:hypothetical protein Tco_0704941 [Tanacetum coccineum]|uniref:Uncharacterized protein n=1 Tax=Tanacetum coccineum TaxID=301880 RepID=A0ABQ4Y4Z0_9ASTR
MAVQRMPYEQFAEYLEEKCGNYFQGLYYQVPNHDLERRLVRVSEDRSLSYMFDVEETFGRLNIYLDHLDMNLSEYLSQAITNEMDAEVLKKICPLKKRYCNDFTIDEMVDWAEMEVEQHGGGGGTSTIDKGKEKVSKDAIEVVESRRITVEQCDSEDPFVEKHVDKYLIYDETTHWRLRKPKVGEKYVTVDQFKECLTYYALANSFSLWYERSSGQRVVAKCGQRPPRLFVPEKGKLE